METRELIKALRDMLPPKVDSADLVCAEGFARGHMYVWEDPEPYFIEAAADKLEQLQKLVDDMLGGHYVDNLDWYANRCRELEEELENIRSDDDGNN